MLTLESRPEAVALQPLEEERIDPHVELLGPDALAMLHVNGTVDGRKSRILEGI